MWVAAPSTPGSCFPAGGNALIDIIGLINRKKVAVLDVSVRCAVLSRAALGSLKSPEQEFACPRGRRVLQIVSFVWKPLDASS